MSGLVGIIAAGSSNDHDLSPDPGHRGLPHVLLGALLIYVKIGLALYWLNGAWKWVPMDHRFGKDGKRYTRG